jgi:hypothetical protein
MIDGESLWVRDFARVTHFIPHLASAAPDSAVSMQRLPGRGTERSRRGRLVNGVYYSPGYHFPLQGGYTFFYVGLRGADVVDTVFIPPLPNLDRIRGTSYRGGRIDAAQSRIINALARAPFEPVPVWDMDGAGHLIGGSGSDGRLQQFDRSGSVMREFVLPVRSRRISETAREDSLRALAARLDSLSVPMDEIHGVSRYITDGTLPDLLPDYLAVHVSADGNVWVEVWPESGRDGTDFVVFDSTGEYRATVSVPVSLSPDVLPHFQGGRIVGVTVDPVTGVQTVVVADVILPD